MCKETTCIKNSQIKINNKKIEGKIYNCYKNFYDLI